MKLQKISGLYSILKLASDAKIPEWALQSDFFSISKSSEELSIVCQEKLVPININANKSWSLIKVIGPLDFSLTGILNLITQPLAEEKISIFAISTFDTDYLLVKQDRSEKAVAVLKARGFEFVQ